MADPILFCEDVRSSGWRRIDGAVLFIVVRVAPAPPRPIIEVFIVVLGPAARPVLHVLVALVSGPTPWPILDAFLVAGPPSSWTILEIPILLTPPLAPWPIVFIRVNPLRLARPRLRGRNRDDQGGQ
jgi:hypothetical protein